MLRFILTALICFIGIFSLTGLKESALSIKENELFEEKYWEPLALREKVADIMTQYLKLNQRPSSLMINWNEQQKSALFNYTTDESLQKEADTLLLKYKPDYGAIFMIDAQTGEILAMSSYQRDSQQAENLNLRASFPAASIFKVVTATTAVDKAGVEPQDRIHYNGGAYTLYRKNVMTDKITRWTNVITLKDAFARSINTAFGRLSLEKLTPADLEDYANRFMFNHEIPADFYVEKGTAQVPQEKNFELTEAASGYNKINRMSPVQGAMIAASIINDGNMPIPYIVRSIYDDEKNVIYEGSTILRKPIMTALSAAKVRQLMERTIIAGTSRKSFRNLTRDRRFEEIEMGGKTGHLTGDNPKGRVDWFVGYAASEDRKLAIATITVNKKFWTVKSAYLGQSMFKAYFKPKLVMNGKNRQRIANN